MADVSTQTVVTHVIFTYTDEELGQMRDTIVLPTIIYEAMAPGQLEQMKIARVNMWLESHDRPPLA
jgi:hypothetical protein